MVKRCKALIYIAGEKDSYGKCAEAAMALSWGSPSSSSATRGKTALLGNHSLSRLIEFETVAVWRDCHGHDGTGVRASLPHLLEQDGILAGEDGRGLFEAEGAPLPTRSCACRPTTSC